MTFTIKRSTAILLIAVAGIICGIAATQVLNALTSEAKAVAPYVPPFEKEVTKMAKDLHAIRAAVGEKGILDGDIVDLLKKISGNTWGTCQNSGGNPFCHS